MRFAQLYHKRGVQGGTIPLILQPCETESENEQADE